MASLGRTSRPGGGGAGGPWQVLRQERAAKAARARLAVAVEAVEALPDPFFEIRSGLDLLLARNRFVDRERQRREILG